VQAAEHLGPVRPRRRLDAPTAHAGLIVDALAAAGHSIVSLHGCAHSDPPSGTTPRPPSRPATSLVGEHARHVSELLAAAPRSFGLYVHQDTSSDRPAFTPSSVRRDPEHHGRRRDLRRAGGVPSPGQRLGTHRPALASCSTRRDPIRSGPRGKIMLTTHVESREVATFNTRDHGRAGRHRRRDGISQGTGPALAQRAPETAWRCPGRVPRPAALGARGRPSAAP
jgi:hypothetical protein